MGDYYDSDEEEMDDYYDNDDEDDDGIILKENKK